MRRKKNKPENSDEEILKDERMRLENMISQAMHDISKKNDADVMAEVEKDTLAFIETLGKYRQPEQAEEPVHPVAKGRIPDHKKQITTYVLKYKTIGDTFTTDEICFILGKNLGRAGYTPRVVSQNLNNLQKKGDLEFDTENKRWVVIKALNYRTVEKVAIDALTEDQSKGFVTAKIISDRLGAEEDNTLTMSIGRYLSQVAEKHGLKREAKSQIGNIYYEKRPECITLSEEIMKWCKDEKGNFRVEILAQEAYSCFEDKTEPAHVRQTLLKNGYKLDKRMSSKLQHRFIRKEHYDSYVKNSQSYA